MKYLMFDDSYDRDFLLLEASPPTQRDTTHHADMDVPCTTVCPKIAQHRGTRFSAHSSKRLVSRRISPRRGFIFFCSPTFDQRKTGKTCRLDSPERWCFVDSKYLVTNLVASSPKSFSNNHRTIRDWTDCCGRNTETCGFCVRLRARGTTPMPLLCTLCV